MEHKVSLDIFFPSVSHKFEHSFAVVVLNHGTWLPSHSLWRIWSELHVSTSIISCVGSLVFLLHVDWKELFLNNVLTYTV